MAGSVSAQPSPDSRRLITRLVLRLDRQVRQAEHIFEYSNDPRCLFRIERALAVRAFMLSDGTLVAPGDPLVQLHFWNEHFFPRKAGAQTLAWGVRLRRAFRISLAELSDFLDRDGAYDGVSAIFGNPGVVLAARSAQLLRVCRTYGFEPIVDGHRVSAGEHMHRAGENILSLLLTLAVNPSSARLDLLASARAPVAISRAELRKRFGDRRARGR